MKNSLLDPPGELLSDHRALTVPKASELAWLLARASHPFARPVEARRGQGFETVVFDADVELPQVVVHPIRPVERIAVIFPSDDADWPEVLALRASFPRVPHLMLRRETLPRSLCLFDVPYAELRPHWTAARLVERIRDWLRLTARGELHADDQPLEPVLLGSVGWVVVPHTLLGQPEAAVSVMRLPDHLGRLVLRVRPRSAGEDGSQSFAAMVFSCSPREHGAIERAPSNLAELHALAQVSGDDLIGALHERLRSWSGVPGILKVPLILLIAFPKTRAGGAAVEATDLWAFVTADPIGQVGEDLGIWTLQGGHVGLLVLPDTTRRGNGTAIDVLTVIPTLSRGVAARMNGIETSTAPRIVAVGAGALGSQVVLNAARSGYGEWTVIDRDVFWPHNGARHALCGAAAGWQKADAVAAMASSIVDGAPPVAGIVADVLDPGDRRQAVDDALRTTDVVVDMSASVIVARHLSKNTVAVGRRISVFLNPSGSDLVLLAEDHERRFRLNQLELQYYRAVCSLPELAGHLRPAADRVRYGGSCRDVTASIPQDLVALHAAIATRAIRRTAAETSAAIGVWRTKGEDLGVDVVQVPVYGTQVHECGDWTVLFDDFVVRKLRELRAARLPNETGGILIGAMDLEEKVIGIVDTVPSPPDSDEWPTGYIRGCQGLIEPTLAISDATAGLLHYVGEWHSHPDGCPTTLSSADVNVLSWLTERMGVDGMPGLVVIAGDQEVAAYVGRRIDA